MGNTVLIAQPDKAVALAQSIIAYKNGEAILINNRRTMRRELKIS